MKFCGDYYNIYENKRIFISNASWEILNRTFFTRPPNPLLKDTHQRSKNAKIGVLLGILRMSSKLKKGLFFSKKSAIFRNRGTLLTCLV